MSYLKKINKKIMAAKKLTKKVDTWKKSGKKIVFTNGCFDIVHRGHVELLKYCREIFKVLEAHEIGSFFYIGGNDSSDTLRILSEQAQNAN